MISKDESWKLCATEGLILITKSSCGFQRFTGPDFIDLFACAASASPLSSSILIDGFGD